MRAGAIAVVALWSGAAAAEPRLEVGGFAGVVSFGEDTELGNSWAPEQVPGTAAMLGARAGWIAVPTAGHLAGGRVQLGVEAELAVAPAFTGSVVGGRSAYFAPVFGWHAHGLLRLAWSGLGVHLVAGGGGETVASSSPFMSRETDPVGYWGAGIATPVTGRWRLRIDARHGIMADRDDGLTSTLAVQVGVATSFGPPVHPAAPPPARPIAPRPVLDRDGDGIPDSVDRCPTEPETVNGIEDDDGCPEPDDDGDGIVNAVDRCPDAAEDRDGFEDDDGCPDPDNDGDGIEDGADACPNAPETVNGIADDDGCPDRVPDEILRVIDDAGKLRFARGSARLDEAGEVVLSRLRVALLAHPGLRITIVAHPASAREAELARRRARAVKWFLVDQGVTTDRLEIEIGALSKTQPIELRLTPPR